jgi:hypothetical protein
MHQGAAKIIAALCTIVRARLFDWSAEPINRDSSELRDSYLGLAR